MSLKSLIFIILLIFTASIFSQEIDFNNIPVEVKTPVEVFGAEEDEVQLYRPEFIKFNPFNQYLYVAEKGNNRVIVLDSALKSVKIFGRRGQGPGEFVTPYTIVYFRDENIIITDWGNSRIQIFDKTFEYSSGFINKAISIFRPDIAVDSKFRIFLSMPEKGNLFTVFNKEGVEQESFGEIYKAKEWLDKKFKNSSVFTIDGEDQLYCAFMHYPVIRKYGSDSGLAFEKDLKDVTEINEWFKYWKNRASDKNLPREAVSPVVVYFFSIDTDEKFIYLALNHISQKPVLVLDKTNGNPVKKIFLKYDNMPDYSRICLTVSDEHIYTIDFKTMLLYKFEK